MNFDSPNICTCLLSILTLFSVVQNVSNCTFLTFHLFIFSFPGTLLFLCFVAFTYCRHTYICARVVSVNHWSLAHCMSLIHVSIKHSRSVLKPHKLLCLQQSEPTSPTKAFTFVSSLLTCHHAVVAPGA